MKDICSTCKQLDYSNFLMNDDQKLVRCLQNLTKNCFQPSEIKNDRTIDGLLALFDF